MSIEMVLMLAVIVLQVFLIFQNRKSDASQFAVIGDRLIKIEESMRNSLEASLNIKESKELIKKVGEEVFEFKGRIGGFAEKQDRAIDSILKLQTDLPVKVGDGLASVLKGIQEEFSKNVGPSLDSMRRSISEGNLGAEQRFKSQSDALTSQFRSLQDVIAAAFKEIRDESANHRKELGLATGEMRREVSETLSKSSESIERKMESLRETTGTKVTELKGAVDAALKAELGAIRAENSSKLEEMRKTVDEKLHATLEQRLGESFKQVSDRLEQVHRGLGEMQTLATGVGDLKKVLTNVKTRGTWGEVQLEALLDQVLTAEQYGKNIATRPGSSARVEFAIRLPGKAETDVPVWLPIDAKFPVEDYQRLVDAQERADVSAIEEAAKALDARIRQEAKTIHEKYVEPPHTTDFAILYLPTEGLYAEVLRRPGLSDTLQRDFKVSVAGPTTIAALLNSLQMGFRSLAIEKRSSEVWTVLSAVKTEFGKFAEALAKTKQKLQEAHNSIEKTETRNRVLTRKLRGVDAMPAPDAALIIGGTSLADEAIDETIGEEGEGAAV